MDEFVYDDGEHTNYQKEKVFSYDLLVMEATRRCSECMSHEMVAGYWNEKVNQQGNVIKTYIEDTRQRFIRSVKALKSLLLARFDEGTNKTINNIYSDLDKVKKQLLNQQWEWFESLNNEDKKQIEIKYGKILPDGFNTDLYWYQKYCEEELYSHEKVYEHLNLLINKVGLGKSKEIIDTVKWQNM